MAAADIIGLEGKLCVVTGAAGGIGAGIADVLSEAGAEVVIADIDEARAKDQAQSLSEKQRKVHAVALDLSDEQSIVRVTADIVERFGTPWALVNNAGLQDREMLLEGTAAHWDRIHGVNIRGPFLMTREVARAMVAGGKGGRIVNIASHGIRGQVIYGLTAYVSSKAAVEGLTRMTAMELAEHKITCNSVLPGGVMTPGSASSTGPDFRGPGLRMAPLGFCDARDMGAAVMFLASESARYVTNQSLAVDAGFSVT